ANAAGSPAVGFPEYAERQSEGRAGAVFAFCSGIWHSYQGGTRARAFRDGPMTHDLIRAWLGLPPGEWPPDHYSLLGLQPGEPDAAHMEQPVPARLDSVRRSQLIHPEEATEAMTRLAQAFVCLTDPEAKRAYDETLFGTPAEPEVVEPSALD